MAETYLGLIRNNLNQVLKTPVPMQQTFGCYWALQKSGIEPFTGFVCVETEMYLKMRIEALDDWRWTTLSYMFWDVYWLQSLNVYVNAQLNHIHSAYLKQGFF